MARTTPQIETTLRIERTIAAPREKVFEAWTEAESLKRWFAPSDEYRIPVAQVDLRAGGRYRIEMHHSSGKVHTVVGEYREIVAPSRLVFSWRWEDDPASPETLVTVEFHARGDATELELTHERFPNAEARENHAKGWNGCLDRLPQAC
ncbi:MAG: hypothetical protein A2W00_00970 [Candidatus Eisenbacteria bacterium RBG_16_71_46]|nr:MAG: hypothetical protein A2W00_00970 [Candidatus Eisenbacteria bacterium RBG_16_71_46]OGF23769.1 MAG: hypothetical protein A2V63_09930 [Candidatus Eisenbacteria bacterium RBG_19FT_COMBO_70_11]